MHDLIELLNLPTAHKEQNVIKPTNTASFIMYFSSMNRVLHLHCTLLSSSKVRRTFVTVYSQMGVVWVLMCDVTQH